MLKTLACPSYINTQHTVEDTKEVIDVAIVPYDQFHSFMVDTHANNMRVIEVNTMLEDLVKYKNFDELNKVINRAKKYLAEK